MEGLYETTARAGLSFGGIYQDNKLRYALEIPYRLSLLIHHDPDGVVPGLEEVPADERPPVNVVHLAYNAMVVIGNGLLALAAWFSLVWWRPHPAEARRARRPTSPLVGQVIGWPPVTPRTSPVT